MWRKTKEDFQIIIIIIVELKLFIRTERIYNRNDALNRIEMLRKMAKRKVEYFSREILS